MGYRKKCLGKKPLGLACGILHDVSNQHIDVHHIKPKCEGGSDNRNKLIALDKFEHERIHSIYRGASAKKKREIKKVLREVR